ncbi:MAG: isoaspartyl peptidase/L-asparaginase [Robiginitomaculum sp.]|nr:MAG: isoaspartyl peptidase/L-asparaginase [Robiginitomaculum sp.]
MALVNATIAFVGLLIIYGCQTGTHSTSPLRSPEQTKRPASLTILIHGGAGSLPAGGMAEKDEAAYRAALGLALDTGYNILSDGGSALDAVQAAIVTMEDNPLFNAGKGAVFTAEGRNELDSSLMDGRDRNAGAVTGVTTIRNPILAARAVMDQSPHVMMARDGAEAFAKAKGLEIVSPDYFYTEKRWQQLQKARAAAKAKAALPATSHFGTVGAVALDANGHIAAGTSTGGMTYKRYGRIGDSPIIGAGTYASDLSCAVSATGWGEFFIRGTAARDICARVQWAGADIQQAADQVIADLKNMGGTGGVLALTPKGTYAFSFSTQMMFRGVRTAQRKDVYIENNDNQSGTGE